MTTPAHLPDIYPQLLGLSQQMLDLASAEKWDELINTEVRYISLVEKLAHHIEHHLISHRAQEQMRPVLRHILDNETQVKHLLQLRMQELSQQIAESSQVKLVNSAYSAVSGLVLFPDQSD